MKIKLKLFLIVFLGFAHLCFSQIANDGSRYASESVLSKGKWVQLKVTENAVYKLTYEDIRKMGFGDPAKVKIYGYGGWILDQDFTKPYIDDLPEVPVWLNKGSDGVFNSGDYLLFYGRGVRKWTLGSTIFVHENNPYSTYASYFVTESDSGPKEMLTQNSYSEATSTLTTFDDYFLHELDQVALLNSGRELFGESFAARPNQNFSFNIPGITNDPGQIQLSFAAYPPEASFVTLSVGDEEIINLNMPQKGSSSYEKAKLRNSIQPWLGNKSENVTVRVSYNQSGLSHLNFISLNVTRNLRFYNNGYTFFRSKESTQTALKYVIDNASTTCLVWDISDTQNVKQINASLEGTKLSFGANANEHISEYVMIDYTKSFLTPEIVGEVKNQNLHGLPQTDMVIIVPEVYAPFAETLAEKHRNVRGLHVTVVQPEWIYNEFSSGTRDATAYRRFMKMFYDRATNEDEKPRYLLLYGDGIFDNRHLTSSASNLDPKNYLLTYQVVGSVDEELSPGTDDYFGFLDDNEGLTLNRDVLDLGIGRFPVSTYEQAQNALNKVTNYMDNKNYGKWKNTLIFTADDTDSPPSTFCLHGDQADRLARYVENTHPQYMVVKSYMDAFQSETRNGQKTYPDAKNKLLTTLRDGCFLMNYTGHGSTSAMSGEDMMNVTDIRQMRFESLPLWITATCDFGWFDGIATSAGEEVFLNKNSAGIALFTTSRVVYSTNNLTINNQLMRNLFTKENGKFLSLGDILRKSKIGVGTDSNKLNFVLLGDPALVLNYPEQKIVLETVNGVSAEESDVTNFRALDIITLEGFIADEAGNPINDFNGEFYTTVFDGKQTIKSVSVDDRQSGDDAHWFFSDYQNVIYKGSSPVKDGRFSVSFRVPLDILYDATNLGKMNFYAFDEQTQLDASGSFDKYTLSGTNEDSSLSDLGPEITYMFLNSESFKDGDDVNETPFFVAEVFDEDGINMTGSGLGHDITICIDNNPSWTYNLNTYYQSQDVNGGSIRFSIPTLPAGKHQLVFRVWDILNNPSTDTLTFNVVKGLKPHIYDITATGSPAKESTDFLLTYDRPETLVEIEIQVFDLAGRAIWTHQETATSSYLNSSRITWNLTNNAGNRVSPGVYVYRAAIKTQEGKEATKSKKLIVLEQ